MKTTASVLFLTALSIGGCNCEGESLNQRTPAQLAVDPALVEFGEVPVTFRASKTLNLRNDGELELHIEQVRQTGANAFTTSTPPTNIPPQGSASMTIDFTPAAEGEVNGILVFVSNAQNSREQTVTLRGSGAAPFVCGECNSPPPPSCLSSSESLTYEASGVCENGQCRYTARRHTCDVYCELETGVCVTGADAGVADAGHIPDAGARDAGQPLDAGTVDAAVPDAGACEPDGVFSLTGLNLTYTCCFGLVDIDIDSFTLSGGATQVSGSPRTPTMNGNGGTCGSGVEASFVEAGGCTEEYSLDVTFSGANTITGTYALTFTGSDCGCFGGVGTPCTDQSFNVSATR